MRKFQWSGTKYSHSLHHSHAKVWHKHWQSCSSKSRWGHSSSWLSRWLLWGWVRRAAGFISVWYEMLSRARAKGGEIDSLRWSTTTKQLSGLRWQNEYWRRPVSSGTGPSLRYHSQRGDWTLGLSLLNWFITQSINKIPTGGTEVCTIPHYTDRQSVLVLSFPSKINSWDLWENESKKVKTALPLHPPSMSKKRDMVKEYEQNY